MLFEGVEASYYGIKLSFANPPVGGSNIKEFYFETRDLLLQLQSFFVVYEIVTQKLEFDPKITTPVKVTNPHEWQDLALLLQQAVTPEEKKGVGSKPGVIADIGGRKLIAKIPSDRYFYDRGTMPSYLFEVDTNQEGTTFIHSVESEKDLKTITDVNQEGDEPQKGRLGYPLIFNKLVEFYSTSLTDAAIVQEMRRILSGHPLSNGHAPVIPVLTAALFASEVSRNRHCFATGLMLLDLIEHGVQAPSQNADTRYSLRNSLWHPDLYVRAKGKYSEEEKKKAALGGYHPMCHLGSYENEFEDGPYQTEDTWANIKSVIILVDWLKNYAPLQETFGATVTNLTKEEYEQQMDPAQEFTVKNFHQTRLLALTSSVGSCVRERISKFNKMLPRTLDFEQVQQSSSNLNNSNSNSSNQPLSLNFSHSIMFKKPTYAFNFPSIAPTANPLPLLDFIKVIDANFTSVDLAFCQQGVAISEEACKAAIRALVACDNFEKLYTFLFQLEKNSLKQIFLYRLILSSTTLCDEFSKYNTKASLIQKLGQAHGLRVGPSDFVDEAAIGPLFSPNNALKFLNLPVADYVALCKCSARIFKRLLLEKPMIADAVLSELRRYEISDLMFHYKSVFSQQELNQLETSAYNNHPKYGQSFKLALDVILTPACIPFTPLTLQLKK